MELYLGKNLYCALGEILEYDHLLKLLLEIKKTVEYSQNIEYVTVFRIRGYFEFLGNNPDLTHTAIIDVILNIIANYTRDEHFSSEGIEEHDFVPLLDDMLKLCQREESIYGGIFEIIGNMYQKSHIWARLIIDEKPQFVTHALECLKAFSTNRVSAQCDVSEDPIMVALKFLRRILDYLPTVFMPFTKAFGVVEAVGAFFVNMTLEMKNNGKVLQKVMKLVEDYSKYNFHCSIKETTGGESIIYLCTRMRLFPRRIPRLMENCIRIDQMAYQPQLPDICDWIIQKVETLNIEDSQDEYVSYISCLCFMLLNRCNDRHKKFLPQLINVLKFIETPSYADMECFVLILVTLNKYYFSDDRLKRDFLNCHIIETLVEKLKWVSGVKTLALDFEHQMAEKKERQYYNRRPNFLESCHHPNPSFKEEYSCVTHSMSATLNNVKEEMYFCDRRDSFPWNTASERFSTRAVNELECSCLDKNIIDMMKGVLIKEIAILIENYMRFHPNVPEELFIALLNCSIHFGQTYLYGYNASKLLESDDCMAHLMTTTVVEKIYGMLEYQHNSICITCSEIRNLALYILRCFEEAARSYKGMNKIMDRLLTDQGEQKTQLILTMPYIVKTSLLAIFLLNFDCLNILTQLLKYDSPLRDRCIEVIYILASQRLSMADPSQVDFTGPPEVAKPEPIKPALAEDRLVTFKLDDGTSLQADRNLLTEKSWYFSVLLDGNFKEKEEEEVALHNVQNESLRLVLHLLKHPETIDQLVMEYNLDFLLDVILLTDEHGQSELCGSLRNRIIKYRMNPKTVSVIYRWSCESRLNLLRVEAVTFAMVHCLENKTRIAMFEALLDVGHVEELILDIRTILESHMKTLVQY